MCFPQVTVYFQWKNIAALSILSVWQCFDICIILMSGFGPNCCHGNSIVMLKTCKLIR